MKLIFWIWKLSHPHSDEHHLLSSSEIKGRKKFRPVWDLNLWPLQYQSSALPTRLNSTYILNKTKGRVVFKFQPNEGCHLIIFKIV